MARAAGEGIKARRPSARKDEGKPSNVARVRNDGGEGVRPGILEIFKESAGVRVRASLEPLLLSAVFAPVFRLESRKLGKIRAAIRSPGRRRSRTAIDRRRKSLPETRLRSPRASSRIIVPPEFAGERASRGEFERHARAIIAGSGFFRGQRTAWGRGGS